jgi:hypothetical protein
VKSHCWCSCGRYHCHIPLLLLLLLLLLQICIAVMHLGRLYLDSSWISVLVAFQCVLLWFRLNYFSR